MLFDSFFSTSGEDNSRLIERLQSYHKRNYSIVLWAIFIAVLVFIVWGNFYRLDQVARASGEIIASSRVQVIQSVDGGVLAELNVREGDVVSSGQILASLDQTRFGASVKEIEARLGSLKAKATRLRAEVIQSGELVFPEELSGFPEQTQLERALFEQRRTGLSEEIRTLENAVSLAREELELVRQLSNSGDVNRSEIIRTEQALNDAESRLIVRKNDFFEEANTQLTTVEDDIAQNEQILTQRAQQLADSVFEAPVSGIVKNVAVTTVGGVLRSGEELMQIIPLDDELIVESKVSPADIALVRPGLEATVRFDPFDYTIYGGAIGEVIYVSPDTLKEEVGGREETYYRVHVAMTSSPVTTTTGRELEILPGMTAQVDIRTGDRTVMDYLLKPLRKTLTESLGER
jgi:membrane fusion protein, adhesin transport system